MKVKSRVKPSQRVQDKRTAESIACLLTSAYKSGRQSRKRKVVVPATLVLKKIERIERRLESIDRNLASIGYTIDWFVGEHDRAKFGD